MKWKKQNYVRKGREGVYYSFSGSFDGKKRRGLYKVRDNVPFSAYKRKFESGGKGSVYDYLKKPIVISHPKGQVVVFGGRRVVVKDKRRVADVRKALVANPAVPSRMFGQVASPRKGIGLKRAMERVRRYGRMVDLFGSVASVVEVGSFSAQDLDSRLVYSRLSEKLGKNQDELMKVMVGNRAKIDSKIMITSVFTRGDVKVWQVQFNGSSADAVKQWALSVVRHADEGAFHSPPPPYAEQVGNPPKGMLKSQDISPQMLNSVPQGQPLKVRFEVSFKNKW